LEGLDVASEDLYVKDNPALEPRLIKKANRKKIGTSGVIDKREP
jgi:hypothetical protein